MGKILNTYRSYSPAGMKAKASCPTAANITEGVGYIDCSNISVNQVKGVLGAATYSIYDLCRHANINRWANFSPIVRSISPYQQDYSSALVNSVPSECHLGYFAGYNHNAETPGWWNLSSPLDVWVNIGQSANFDVYVKTGEINFNSWFGATYVAVVLFNGSNVPVGYGQVALSGLGDGQALISVNTGIQSSDHTDYYVRAYLLSAAISDLVNDLPTNIVCLIPNCTASTVHIHIKQVSTACYDATGNLTPPSPWVQNGSSGMNWTTGIFTITYDLEANNTWTNVRVYAVLRDWTNAVIGQANIFNGPYSPFDSVYGTADLGMTNIPNYGYSVKVYFEYT